MLFFALGSLVAVGIAIHVALFGWRRASAYRVELTRSQRWWVGALSALPLFTGGLIVIWRRVLVRYVADAVLEKCGALLDRLLDGCGVCHRAGNTGRGRSRPHTRPHGVTRRAADERTKRYHQFLNSFQCVRSRAPGRQPDFCHS
jgi:hypothetical protein